MMTSLTRNVPLRTRTVAVGPASAHRAKGRVARSVQESDLCQLLLALRMRERNRIGTNMLRNTTGFASRYIGLANDIQQSCLTMVNVAHDCDDRGARRQIL